MGSQVAFEEDAGFYALEYIRLLMATVQPSPANWNTAGFARRTFRIMPLILIGTGMDQDLASKHGVSCTSCH